MTNLRRYLEKLWLLIILLAWRQFALNGTFIGELSDPFPVKIDHAGNLSVDWFS
jgi:hypothetical protein